MRIANVNPAADDNCPTGWNKITSPVAVCRAPNDNGGCFPVTFTTHSVQYSRVSGMVIGYQKGTTDGFAQWTGGLRTIDNAYLDGVSVTYSMGLQGSIFSLLELV